MTREIPHNNLKQDELPIKRIFGEAGKKAVIEEIYKIDKRNIYTLNKY